MKKNFEKHSKFEKILKKKNFKKLVEELKIFNNIKKQTKNICEHDCKNGKTVVIILSSGLIEVHEILSKKCIYLCLSSRDKKSFEKIKKELESIDD